MLFRSFDLDVAARAVPLDAAVDAAAGLAPASADCAALGDDIGLELEFIAVAGAGEGLVEARTAGADRIGRAAPETFGRAVIQGHRAGAGPDPCEAVKWP